MRRITMPRVLGVAALVTATIGSPADAGTATPSGLEASRTVTLPTGYSVSASCAFQFDDIGTGDAHVMWGSATTTAPVTDPITTTWVHCELFNALGQVVVDTATTLPGPGAATAGAGISPPRPPYRICVHSGAWSLSGVHVTFTPLGPCT